MVHLSSRERDVLTRVGKHMTSKDIAIELKISPRTVHACLENIYFKLRVSGYGARAKAYSEAVKLNLID
jgi:DNA-binding CsgD family transcriptional regulator|tara:strand:+ start:946 stop:1152 length:207 start_codon:yes stop_codon:yes gene_type:complete